MAMLNNQRVYIYIYIYVCSYIIDFIPMSTVQELQSIGPTALEGDAILMIWPICPSIFFDFQHVQSLSFPHGKGYAIIADSSAGSSILHRCVIWLVGWSPAVANSPFTCL